MIGGRIKCCGDIVYWIISGAVVGVRGAIILVWKAVFVAVAVRMDALRETEFGKIRY